MLWMLISVIWTSFVHNWSVVTWWSPVDTYHSRLNTRKNLDSYADNLPLTRKALGFNYNGNNGNYTYLQYLHNPKIISLRSAAFNALNSRTVGCFLQTSRFWRGPRESRLNNPYELNLHEVHWVLTEMLKLWLASCLLLLYGNLT